MTSIGAARAWSATAALEPGPPSTPARLHRLAQGLQHADRVVPADAGIGDALAVFERGRVVLAGVELLHAAVQVALDHHPEDATRAAGDLCGDVARHVDLALMLLARVGVAAIDHQAARQLGFLDLRARGRDAGRIIVGRLAAAQDHVAVVD